MIIALAWTPGVSSHSGLDRPSGTHVGLSFDNDRDTREQLEPASFAEDVMKKLRESIPGRDYCTDDELARAIQAVSVMHHKRVKRVYGYIWQFDDLPDQKQDFKTVDNQLAYSYISWQAIRSPSAAASVAESAPVSSAVNVTAGTSTDTSGTGYNPPVVVSAEEAPEEEAPEDGVEDWDGSTVCASDPE